jgi:hypothetical protein
MKKIKLGDNPIMFGDIKGCGACQIQDSILKKNGKGHFLYIDVHKLRKYPALSNKIKVMPTWYIPTGNGSGKLHEGVIRRNLNSLLERKTVKKTVKRRTVRFGESSSDIPQIGTLAKYGKNFPDGAGFQPGTSFMNVITQKWGNPLLAGTLGREFGPGGTDQIYSNEYLNNIRMAYPGGDLDTTLNLNRSCNMYNPVPSPSGGNADPVVNSAGMIYNSQNPQIVNMTSFGKRRNPRRNLFGNLYAQMGPTPEKQYLLNRNTFNSIYAGGGQGEPPRPRQVSNQNYYIGQAREYYPVQSSTGFGRFKKSSLVKPSKKVKKEKSVVKLKKPKVSKKKEKKGLEKPKVSKLEKITKIKSKKPGPGDTLTVKFGRIKIN